MFSQLSITKSDYDYLNYTKMWKWKQGHCLLSVRTLISEGNPIQNIQKNTKKKQHTHNDG